MEKENRYRIYSQWLKNKYGQKVYKIPINIPVSCPNRDGTKAKGGCIYCGAKGGGNETLSDLIPVKDQLDQNIAYIGKRYHAKKFIAYFQSFSNTYCSIDDFKAWINDAIRREVVEIAISTRPDCIRPDQLSFLKEIKKNHQIEITIELGLQSVNPKTLVILNRCHSLDDYKEAVMMIHAAGLSVCTHLILDLPWDSDQDVIEAASLLSDLKSEFVKCHSLYIEKNTKLNDWYQAGDLKLLTKDDYIRRTILFLEHLSDKVVIQRLIGRAPQKNSVITNWNMSWWKIKEELEEKMRNENSFQGRYNQSNLS